MAEVLIVDDDSDIRQMLAYALGTSGVTVRHAADGEEALRAMAERPPACVVLDLMMPEIDGFEVLARMRAENIAPDTKVVILSCRSDESAFVRAWQLGADEFLVKPMDPDHLVARVHELTTVRAA